MAVDKDSQALNTTNSHLELKSEQFQIENAQSKLNTIDLELMAKNAITWKSKAALRLAIVILVQGLSCAAFAIDGNVIGSINAIPSFREHFDVGVSGGGLGIILAAMSIGNAVASPFQWLADWIGRRGVTFLGSSILVVACVLQAVAPNRACLIVGRLFAGVGASLSATCGPMYMSEVAPACYRGLAVGLYCSCYSIGSIVIACIVLGGSYMENNWSWRLPLIIQIVPPLVVAVLVYPCTPESPRYLVAQNKIDKARQVIARYQTASGSVDDPVVVAEIQQIQDSMELMTSKPWDFRVLWTTKASRRRLWIIFLYSFFQQCNGSGMLSYYFAGILTLVGITNSQQQLGINLGLTVVAYLATLAGSTFIDKVTRRFLLISSMCIFVFFLGLISITGGLYANNISVHSTGIATVAFIFLFNICNGLFVAVLHNVYPNEVLHYSQRAKGMGMYSFFQNCFGFIMTYGVSYALQAWQWKIYFLFIGIDLVCIYLTWQFFPEFSHLSLEEIDTVFETPGVNPVKMSKKLQIAKKEKRKDAKEDALA
ncbi:MFS sugar transporter transporter [Fusarium sp. NRRL 25303]|nr:MFS sugar transporter transporter [Fusarium sp. NRRL 25303]